MRLFFKLIHYCLQSHALRDQLDKLNQSEWKTGLLHPHLSWTHYRTLLKVERQTARDFYEIETIRS